MPLTDQGYTYPRLVEIIENLKTKAVELFQDLVPEGEVVNVEDNSALGRMIGIISPSLADAYESSQQVYDAFNINAATGVALDNLTALGGVARAPASSTITPVLLSGSVGTTIDSGSKVTDVRTGKFHSLLSTTVLDGTAVTSATLSILTVADSTAYTISYQKTPDTLAEGLIPVTITSGVGATTASILAAIAAEIAANHATALTATVVNSTLVVSTLAYTSKVNMQITANLNIGKVTKTNTVSCDDTGTVDIPANSVTRIAVPVLGWDSVTNPVSGISGTDRERDSELRARYKIAKFGDGANLTESLYSAIYAIDGVESVILVENDLDVAIVTPAPVPAHSFYTVVLGGSSAEIAKAIWNNKPAGILAYGTTETISVLDSQGSSHTISFDRPSALDIYVSINISVQSNFAPDGADQIKAAVAEYINTLLIGEDLIYSRLYTPINSVVGHYVNSLTVGTSPSPVGISNVVVGFNQKAACTAANVVITVS